MFHVFHNELFFTIFSLHGKCIAFPFTLNPLLILFRLLNEDSSIEMILLKSSLEMKFLNFCPPQ